MNNYDYTRHVKGESLYIDDISVPEDILYASVFFSPSAHGKINSIDTSGAKKVKGVKAVFTAKDIPGQNQIGGIIADEPLLADGKVDFIGQPVALLIADTFKAAKTAREKIQIDIEELPVITDPRKAAESGELIIPPQVFSNGNVNETWANCDIVVEGRVDSGGQEHLYLETQGSIALPAEDGGIKLFSSTQGPTAVQRATARVLGLPMNRVEVDVLRLGGGFGGKEDQANAWASLAALGAFLLKQPVKLILSRQDDIKLTGKRHPYSSDFKIGLTKDGKFLAYEVVYYQNAGASADLSPAILDRTLFHATNSYNIPNVKATGLSCRTNLPPNTAFRGFGGPQAMFVIESAIHKAAARMGIEASEIQRKNLIRKGEEFYYGQALKDDNVSGCWQEAESNFKFDEIRKSHRKFNSENRLVKKGMAVMPVCFGISFTNTFMNQASALIHIYSDGSIGVSTGAVEMGQGVNEKLRQVAAEIFSVNPGRIKIETSNTTRAANTSPTAASSSADLNGKAVEAASKELLSRLLKSAKDELGAGDKAQIIIKDEKVFLDGKDKKIDWQDLVKTAFLKRVNLSAQAQYATQGIHFDKKTAKGNPFAYHAVGTAVIEVKLDCLRGTYEIEVVKAVHDFGKSLNPVIDRGQAEGALLQGIGWMTIEEVNFSEQGILRSNSLSTYKVPDIHFAPKELEIKFLEQSYNPNGIFNSKAIGEPPLMYGIGVYFAILNAMNAFRPEAKFDYSAPITPEKVMLALYTSKKEAVITPT